MDMHAEVSISGRLSLCLSYLLSYSPGKFLSPQFAVLLRKSHNVHLSGIARIAHPTMILLGGLAVLL